MNAFTPFDLGPLKLGVATASLQIEGGDRNNNWYDWAALPGTIEDGSTPLRATRHWERWREDTDAMAQMGFDTYRMSIEWSRIEPSPGEFDDVAIGRYREELVAVREAGITPLVTLHHFTHPSWFAARGEFTDERSVDIFLRFAEYVVTRLGDVVTDWVTFNEPNVYATGAYLFKEFPPGKTSWPSIRKVLRNMARAHCLAYRMIHRVHAANQYDTPRVGFAHHMRAFAPLVTKNPLHRLLSGVNGYLFQDGIADAMCAGKFPALLGQPDDVTPGAYYDFLGLNYYSRTAVSKFDDGTFPGVPVNDLGWEVYPAGLIECAQALHDKYPGPIWVTENGTCDNPGGGELESFRPRFILEHLAAIAGSSLPFERYYHWCFVDNWEWNLGEVPRFGLVHLDYETGERTRKPSADMYAQLCRGRRATQNMWDTYAAGQAYPVAPPS